MPRTNLVEHITFVLSLTEEDTVHDIYWICSSQEQTYIGFFQFLYCATISIHQDWDNQAAKHSLQI